MTTLGFGQQVLNNNWVADDFTVSDAAGWTIDTATFFAYQTGSTTTSTMTNVNWILYDGDPSSGGSVITTGSGLMTSVWSNIYRATETSIGATDRPIMATTVDMGGLSLAQGTYWLAWQTAGSLASGPWAPPITIIGQATTGNGLQSLAGTTSWAPANDGGSLTRQGFPFILEGSVGGTLCSAPADIPWASVDPVSGTVAAAGSETVDVTFDSTGLAAGTYSGNLCITSNDPDPGQGNGTGLVVVPVELTVEGEPSIVITKTVGLDPGVCAATDSLTVAAGSTVYYCYEVTNTGSISLTLHDLDDDLLGPIFTALAYDLGPGQSVNTVAAGVEVSATYASGVYTNTATWTAYNPGPTDVVTATDTAVVTVEDAIRYLPMVYLPPAPAAPPSAALPAVMPVLFGGLFIGGLLFRRR
jgi:hypothetical protein